MFDERIAGIEAHFASLQAELDLLNPDRKGSSSQNGVFTTPVPVVDGAGRTVMELSCDSGGSRLAFYGVSGQANTVIGVAGDDGGLSLINTTGKRQAALARPLLSGRSPQCRHSEGRCEAGKA